MLSSKFFASPIVREKFVRRLSICLNFPTNLDQLVFELLYTVALFFQMNSFSRHSLKKFNRCSLLFRKFNLYFLYELYKEKHKISGIEFFWRRSGRFNNKTDLKKVMKLYPTKHLFLVKLNSVLLKRNSWAYYLPSLVLVVLVVKIFVTSM